MSIEEHDEHSHEPTGFEVEETPIEQVDEVIVAFDDALFESKSGHHTDTKILHDRVCHTELKLLFENYEQHHILTVDDLQRSIDIVLAALDKEEGAGLSEEDTSFLASKRTLLTNRAVEIDRAARRYVQSISKFFHVARQKIRMEPEDFKAEFQRIDQVRRIAHDGLIETLSIYTRTINELSEYGLLDEVPIEQWHHRDRFLSEDDSKGKVFVFAPEVLRNRDLVKDWAISAHLSKRLHEIDELQKGLPAE